MSDESTDSKCTALLAATLCILGAGVGVRSAIATPAPEPPTNALHPSPPPPGPTRPLPVSARHEKIAASVTDQAAPVLTNAQVALPASHQDKWRVGAVSLTDKHRSEEAWQGKKPVSAVSAVSHQDKVSTSIQDKRPVAPGAIRSQQDKHYAPAPDATSAAKSTQHSN